MFLKWRISRLDKKVNKLKLQLASVKNCDLQQSKIDSTLINYKITKYNKKLKTLKCKQFIKEYLLKKNIVDLVRCVCPECKNSDNCAAIEVSENNCPAIYIICQRCNVVEKVLDPSEYMRIHNKLEARDEEIRAEEEAKANQWTKDRSKRFLQYDALGSDNIDFEEETEYKQVPKVTVAEDDHEN